MVTCMWHHVPITDRRELIMSSINSYITDYNSQYLLWKMYKLHTATIYHFSLYNTQLLNRAPNSKAVQVSY
jgi:hypothetical protein